MLEQLLFIAGQAVLGALAIAFFFGIGVIFFVNWIDSIDPDRFLVNRISIEYIPISKRKRVVPRHERLTEVLIIVGVLALLWTIVKPYFNL